MTTRTAEVVIIGGGVIGASVAYHLASRGCRGVVVLSHDEGSTPKATGGFRAQFSTEGNVRLSLLSREKLLRFQEEIGVDSGYRPCGYLFAARELEALQMAQRVQHAAGLHEARLVSVEEIRAINPAVATDGLAGGAYCPTDGFIRPMQILEGYRAAAQRLGVRFEFDVECTGIGRGEVRTSRETFSTPKVVNAAGAWAGRVAGLAGVDLAVTPLRRQVASTVPTDALPEGMPMTIFTEDGFHLRVREGRVLLLWPTEIAPSFDTTFDESWLDGVVSRAHSRVPILRGVAIDRAACWAGLYEMSPDKHAILGAAPGRDDFYFVNGSSGHGVMHAPALGQLLAEIILDGRASAMNVEALRPSRFAEGRPNESLEFL